MKYDRASKGSRGSASQWNGFLDMHKAYYGNTVGQGLIPPILQSSTIVPATLKKDAEAIGAFQPVRIVKNFGFKNVVDTMPSYEVEPVDAVDGERHGNYGFTLGEGVTEANGGRIVMAGVAIVQLDARDLQYDKTGAEKVGDFDSSYYMVPDSTLSGDTELVVPAGHFKVISWYASEDVEQFNTDDKVYIAIDMEDSPDAFRVKTATDIQGANTPNDSTGVDCQSTTGYVYYNVSESDAPDGDLELVREESKYEITIYNVLKDTIPSGDHLVTYSKEYNRFVVLAASGGGGSTAYMVETGNASLIGGVSRDLEIFEAPAAGSAPVATGNTVSVIHDWQTDMGSVIPSNVRLTVIEYSDGYARPVYIDNNWIYNTTLTQIFADSVGVAAGSVNDTYALFSISGTRVYGYGIGRSGSASSFNVLRTGTYNISVQWDTYNHVANTTIRISDQTTPLISRAFTSADNGSGGYTVWTNYVVNQSMLNSGGAGFLVEHAYAGSSSTNGSNWDNLTINLERVGD